MKFCYEAVSAVLPAGMSKRNWHKGMDCYINRKGFPIMGRALKRKGEVAMPAKSRQSGYSGILLNLPATGDEAD